MKKVIKLDGTDVKAMVEKIIEESKNTKKSTKKVPVTEAKATGTKKPGRVIRLTESEMIEFLDKLATKVENSRRRRS
jgi:hypothetical protein